MSPLKPGRGQRGQHVVETLVFAHRTMALLVVPLLVALLAVAALRAPVADPYAASLPNSSAAMRMAEQYREDFGGANLLRVALVRRDGDIYDTAFLARLAQLTEACAQLPGVGAARVHSLFSADARFIEVVDARYFPAALAPPSLRGAATPELIAKLRANLAKTGALGRWVSGDQRAALIEIEVAPGAAALDTAILRRLVTQELAAPVPGANASRIEAYVAGSAFDALAAQQRLQRSLPALLLAPVLVFLACWAMLAQGMASLMAVATALIAPLAAVAAGRWFGATVELPAALAAYALSLSLNLRFAAAWLAQIAGGGPSFDASLGVWRRLAVGSLLAALAAAAAFATLALLPVMAARVQAMVLVTGALFALLVERLLLPVLLSGLRIRDPLRLSMTMARRTRLATPLANAYKALARPEASLVLLTAAATIFGWSLWQRQGAEIAAGGASASGAPLIARAFPLAVNRLWIAAEAEAGACAQPQTLDQIDRLAWQLDNTRGVLATQAMPGVVRQIHTAFAEGSPKFAVLPRRRDMLIQAIAPLAPELRLGNANCSALPIWVATDGRAETLARLAAVVAAFERDNAAEFFDAHRQLDPNACTARIKQRRKDARPVNAALVPDAEGRPVTCPVHFELGGGPLGVTAAQTQALAGPASWLVWAALGSALLVLTWSLGNWTAAAAILFGVAAIALFAEAVLAVRGVAIGFATLPLVTIAVGLGAAFAAPVWQAMAVATPRRAEAGALPEGVAALAISAVALLAAAMLLLSPLAGLDLASRWFWLALFGALASALVLLPVIARLALAERTQSTSAASGRRY